MLAVNVTTHTVLRGGEPRSRTLTTHAHMVRIVDRR